MTQDSLVLRVPQGYERQEGTSIFDLKASDAPKEFVIGASFTVKRVPTASLTHDHFKASAPSAHDERCFDCTTYDSVTIDTVVVKGRLLVVERARLTGTIQHYERWPMIFVRVPLDGVWNAVLEGEYDDLKTNGQLLVAVASTIRSRVDR